MKIKKLLALVLALTMVLSCVTAFAAMEELTEPYYEVKCQSDFSQFEDEIVGTNLSGASLFNKVNNVYTEGYVKDGDGFYYLTGGENGTTPSEWLVPLGRNTVSESFSGEYVLSFRSKFVNYRYSANTGTVASYLTYDKSDLNKSFFGVKCVYDNPNQTSTTGTATMYFEYRYKDTVNVGYSLGTWTYTSNEWYTYHSVYNFDTRIINVYVYDSTGDEVAHFSHELLNSINGTTIPYKNVTTSSVYVDGTKRGATFVGDFVFAQTLKKPVTAEFDSDLVSVTFGGKTVTSGVATPVDYGSDAIFTIVPKDEYEITGITVDGQPINNKSEVSFESIKEAHSFKVTAKYDDYNEVIVGKITHEDMPESALATAALAEHYNNSNPKNYYNEGNNIMYQIFSVNGTASNRRDWYSGPNSEAVKVLTNDLTGEYIVEHKLKFSNTASDVRYVGDNELRMQLKYSDSSKYDAFGFVIHDNNGDRTADIKFGYSANGAADSTVSLGKTWTFNLAEWYTIRQVYNFDTMKADMYIYNAAGTEVGRYSHDIASGDYKFVKFESIAIQAGAKSRIGLDNLAIYKTIAKPVVVNYDNTMGTVKYNGAEVVSGEKIPVAYNSATPAVFSIEAKEGYEVSDIKVNGESKGNLIDSYEFKNLTADQTLEVVFTKKAPAQPEVSLDSYLPATDYVYTKDGVQKVAPYTVIMYGKVTGVPYEYGFKLGGGNLPETYKLAHVSTLTEEGEFAIRVVGDVLTTGSYTATPYVVINNGDADTDSADETIVIE